MNTANVFVTLGGLLLILFILWYFFGMEDGEEELAVTSDGSPVYQCPMHRWIKSADPAALCSVCGMKLVRRGG